MSVTGDADLNIIIRTAIVTPDTISIGTGGAVVNQSTPEGEYEEMLLKANAVVRAVSAGMNSGVHSGVNSGGNGGANAIINYWSGSEVVTS